MAGPLFYCCAPCGVYKQIIVALGIYPHHHLSLTQLIFPLFTLFTLSAPTGTAPNVFACSYSQRIYHLDYLAHGWRVC